MLSSQRHAGGRQAAPFRRYQLPAIIQVSVPRHRCSLVIRAAGNVSSNDFKTGLAVEMDGAPWKIVEFLHVKPGKGAAFVRSKLKNILSGTVVEKTFRAGENVPLADMERRGAQHTYVDGNDYVFMDLETYEEVRVEQNANWAQFTKEGMEATLLFWNNQVINVELPTTVDLKIVSTEPGVKGGREAAGTKPATLETGAVIQVPLFVTEGQVVKVDTRDGKYSARA